MGRNASINVIPSVMGGPNGPVANVPAITVFLAVLERRSNGWDASNGHIASPW
jgi:hypothetical protein